MFGNVYLNLPFNSEEKTNQAAMNIYLDFLMVSEVSWAPLGITKG